MREVDVQMQRQALGTATLTALVASMFRKEGSRAPSPADFMPDSPFLPRPKRAAHGRQSLDEQIALLQHHQAMLGSGT